MRYPPETRGGEAVGRASVLSLGAGPKREWQQNGNA